ncbi:MAG: MFS transporter, partial [Alphaproteobacteria bacterium]|nr:MFS transporter [Alphaproteobacteria bacterium]
MSGTFVHGNILAVWSGLTNQQKSAVLASYLGWTLDAFDFFLLVFVLDDVAKEFETDVSAVSFAIVLTLAARPLGALLFGLAADYYGRRPVLMINILSFSLLEFASGFAPGLAVFLALRALFGVAMGGEWGVGASLTMETIPAQTRGAISGLLQTGYPSGYLLASFAYFFFFGIVGWRGLFLLGALPAFLVLYIRGKVEESPVFLAKGQKRERASLATLRPYAGRFLYAVALMTAFNFLSHGTQDLYPTFLRLQHDFDPHTVGVIAIVYNIGAILGGLFFGALSERIGRRRGIVIAAFVAFLLIPLWAYGTGKLV